MNQSQTLSKLAPALIAAQKEIKFAKTTTKGVYGNYATLGDVIQATHPILNAHGLAIMQTVTSDAGKIGVTTRLIHESGEFMEDTATIQIPEEKNRSAAQSAGAVITYLRRYAYGIVGLYTDDDTDAAPVQQKQPAKVAPFDWSKRPGTLVNDITEKIGYFGKDRNKVLFALNSMTANGKINPTGKDEDIFATVNKAANDKANAKAAA